MIKKRKLEKHHKEKQFFWLLIKVLVTCGTEFFPELPIASDLRRADGRGKFSGTMVSNELRRHGGHNLLSLHFWTLDFDFEAIIIL